jgi:hypothetical protein
VCGWAIRQNVVFVVTWCIRDRDRKRSGDRIQPHVTQFSEAQLPHKIIAVDDLDATIKRRRTVAGTLILGSLVLVAAVSWQPLTLLIDTMLH